MGVSIGDGDERERDCWRLRTAFTRIDLRTAPSSLVVDVEVTDIGL